MLVTWWPTEIAKRKKTFKEGEFFKDLMLKVADIECRSKTAIQCVSLAQMKITRRVEKIGYDLHDQLQRNAQKYVSVSLALDESTDIVSIAQLLIFLRGATNDLQVLNF